MLNDDFSVYEEVFGWEDYTKTGKDFKFVTNDNKFKFFSNSGKILNDDNSLILKIDETESKKQLFGKVTKKKIPLIVLIAGITGISTICLVSNAIIAGVLRASNNNDSNRDKDVSIVLLESSLSADDGNKDIVNEELISDDLVSEDANESGLEDSYIEEIQTDDSSNEEVNYNDDSNQEISFDDNSLSDYFVNSDVNENNNVIFNVGDSPDIEYIKNYLDTTYEGELIKYYSEMYGMDPNIVVAICAQESGLNQDIYGVANGIMQIEVLEDFELDVYNYKDNCLETITVSSNYTYSSNPEYTIKCGVAILQDSFNNFNGNFYAGLQGYNFSKYMVDYIFYKNNIVLESVTDYEFVDLFVEASNNPSIYSLDYEKYGDGEYISHVLSHCPSKIIKYRCGQKEFVINVATAELLSFSYNDSVNEIIR